MNWQFLVEWAALATHIAALVMWAALWKKVDKRVYIVVLLGFILMSTHRYAEASLGSETFNALTAFGIAIVGISATLFVHRFVRRTEALQRALKMQGLHTADSVAEKLAEHLGDLRDEIHWYEHQAKANGLPTYPK